jgi:hypothetical protein
MPQTPRPCPKCRERMQEGILPDFGDGAIARQSIWVEGKPAVGPLGGFFGGLRLRGKAQLPITAFRCTSCGYVELSAS